MGNVAVRRLLIDLTPLRASPDFRRLFLGQTLSMIGSQFTVVAVAFQVYDLTRSSLQVGAVSLVQLLPFVAGTLAGGVVGDAVDRRLLLFVVSVLLGVTSCGLAINSLGGRHASVVAIYLVTALAAGLSGVVATSATSSVASLVPSELLTPAYATMQVIDQVGMVTGPALAGLVIASVGLPWLYGIDSLSFIWTATFLFTMARIPPGGSPSRGGLGSLFEGFGYLRGRQQLQGVYFIDLFATVFGLPRALFPALTRTLYHGGPATLGILFAAPAAGALAGSLSSGWLSNIRHKGRSVIFAVVAWGSIIVAFGFARVLWLGIVLLAAAGWADVVSAILRSTIVQMVVTDRLRSRISGLQMAIVEGGPRLGDLESGGVASAFSTQFSIVSGGLACIAGALGLALLLPGFRRHEDLGAKA